MLLRNKIDFHFRFRFSMRDFFYFSHYFQVVSFFSKISNGHFMYAFRNLFTSLI
jgi:hypothetical protein